MKAISLFSGGLDSQLAVKVVQNQGVTVVGLNFISPFFGADERTFCAAEQLGIELLTKKIDHEYMNNVLRNPVYGYGKHMNPCIDCHAYMLRKAGDMMQKQEASFLITGEVLGQRPMSQNRSALKSVEKLSGYGGYILRPLSARLLDPTIPEMEGWLDRNQLLDINGRGRGRQIELAEKFGIKEYPSPAGGCLLTEENFARRLEKMLALKDVPLPEDMDILKLGRHFYLDEHHLLAVGRNFSENERLQKITLPGDHLLKVADRPGPLGLLRAINAVFDSSHLEYAASIVARYSDARKEPIARVKILTYDDNLIKILEIPPLEPDQVPAMV